VTPVTMGLGVAKRGVLGPSVSKKKRESPIHGLRFLAFPNGTKGRWGTLKKNGIPGEQEGEETIGNIRKGLNIFRCSAMERSSLRGRKGGGYPLGGQRGGKGNASRRSRGKEQSGRGI